MNPKEIEQYLVKQAIRYNHVIFKMLDGNKTVFLVPSGTLDSNWILKLRAKFSTADIRLVVCDWDIFRILYADLDDWM